jgi:predicted acyltransferase (DUF342 family)
MEILTVKTEKQSLNQVAVGENVRIFDFVNAYGCSIDDNSKVGAFVEILSLSYYFILKVTNFTGS